jgi:Putative DNA-binding domain
MILHLLSKSHIPPLLGHTARRMRTTSYVATFLRQNRMMSIAKKDRWTEAEVLALPAGEHDYFDRKSGLIVADKQFREKLSKALSAVANSGGGHLLIGVRDDGTFDGVDPVHQGRRKTREWLEQIIATSLTYPLEDFRVHEVEPATLSTIPPGKVVIVIDVGDSILAPHQALDYVYYYRAGSQSLPAPHFYLETLRNRLVAPILKPKLVKLKQASLSHENDRVVVTIGMLFEIENAGRVAAYKWALMAELAGHAALSEDNYRPLPKDGMRFDSTILPSLSSSETCSFAAILRPQSFDALTLQSELDRVLPPSLIVRYRAVSETSPGEYVESRLNDFLDRQALSKQLTDAFLKPQS